MFHVKITTVATLIALMSICLLTPACADTDAPKPADAPESTQSSTESTTPATPPPAVRPAANAERSAPAGFDAAVKLYNEKKYAQAASAFEKFIKSGEDNADIHYYLGACYQQLRKYDQALAQFDWVAKNAKLVSMRNKGRAAAFTLRSYRAGICPGNCLKRSTPGWAHYPGLDPNLLWMKFSYSGGWMAWSTNHLGEVIEFVDGKPVNKGKCPICKGTGQVAKLQ